MALVELERSCEPCDGACGKVSEPDLEHRSLRRDEPWRSLPGFAAADAELFHTHTFQARNSVTRVEQLREVLGDRVGAPFYEDVHEGLRRAPMAIRISPHILSLIDWDDPYGDPLRSQFLPLGSQQLPDHPELYFDSLNEQRDAPVPGLTHRYTDRALFLVLNTCPVYCRYCTRSYAVGQDTDGVEKVRLSVDRQRWEEAFEYIRQHPELEDVVVSGGDVYNLRPEQIRTIGETLLGIDHIRRFRFATKGIAVMPQRILTDGPWVDALTDVVEAGRRLHKEVVVHTHFSHPNEITGITQDAMNLLMGRGVTVRNQSVLQRGVNDDAGTMRLLVKRLSHINVQPYYVFFHDMVHGVEDLRTTLAAGLEVEKHVRGTTSGFNTPTFVVDTQGGGGKRDAHSYEHYDTERGIAVFRSPSVRPGGYFFYFDPLDSLSASVQKEWEDPVARRGMIDEALEAARQGRG